MAGRGSIRPGHRVQTDLAVIKQANDEIEQGLSFRTVGLAARLPAGSADL